MKKAFISGFVILFIIFAASPCAYAVGEDEQEYIDEQLGSLGIDEMLDLIDDDGRDILKETGISEIDFDTLINISPKAFFNTVANAFRGNIAGPLKTLIRLAGVSIMLALADCLKGKRSDYFTGIISVAGCLFISVITAVPLCACISDVCSAIKLSGDFMLLYIPALVAVIAVSGSPLTAFTYNSMLFGVAQMLSQFSKSVVMSLTGILLSFNIVSGVCPELKLDGISSSVKKAVTVSLGFISTIFVGLLTTKGLLAQSGDTVGAKGAKFLAGSFIPVIGSTLGDAFTTVSGCLGMVRSTLGVFGVMALFAINLPVTAQAVLWIAAINAAALFSGVIGQTESAKILKGISQAMTLLLVTLFFCVILLIVSTALIICIKADL